MRSLGSNSLGPECGVAIAAALKLNKTLRALEYVRAKDVLPGCDSDCATDAVYKITHLETEAGLLLRRR